jgi:hypothetical protein
MMFIPFSQPNDWYGVINVAVAHHLVGSDGPVGLLHIWELSAIICLLCESRREKLTYKDNVAVRGC